MTPYVDVAFVGTSADPAIVTAIHRSTARVEQATPIRQTAVTVSAKGRMTSVRLAITLANGHRADVTTSRSDAFFAVAEAFRDAQRHLDTAKRTFKPRFAVAA